MMKSFRKYFAMENTKVINLLRLSECSTNGLKIALHQIMMPKAGKQHKTTTSAPSRHPYYFPTGTPTPVLRAPSHPSFHFTYCCIYGSTSNDPRVVIYDERERVHYANDK